QTPCFQGSLSLVLSSRLSTAFVENIQEHDVTLFLLIMGSRVRVPPRSPCKIKELGKKIRLSKDAGFLLCTQRAHSLWGCVMSDPDAILFLTFMLAIGLVVLA